MNNKKFEAFEAATRQTYKRPKFAVWSSQPTELRSCEWQLVQRYCPSKHISVLTVGCGAGRETLALYKLGFSQLCGVDLTPEFIKIAEQRARDMSARVPFHVASARQLPFPDAQFDLVTMFENIYGHITPRESRLRSLIEARRVMKPGGLLFLEATSIRSVLRYWIAIRILDLLHCLVNPCDLEFGDKLTSDAAQSAMPYAQRSRTHWFSPRELEQELREASFEIVQATTNVGIMSGSAADSRRYHGQGRLLFVIRKPPERSTIHMADVHLHGH
jgi:ubiquinone/menaquinone biosynthesis C-methylase UbiE